MFCFKFNQKQYMKNLTFEELRGLFWRVWGLQKMAKYENMFPNIIEGCFCQKKTCVRSLFELALHITLSPVDYDNNEWSSVGRL